jgi:hypothetical protein
MKKMKIKEDEFPLRFTTSQTMEILALLSKIKGNVRIKKMLTYKFLEGGRL